MRKIGLIASLAAVALAASPSQAQELALDLTDGGLTYFRAVELENYGWTFTTSQDRSVTALGLFDSDADGLFDPHPVGIWDASGALVVSTIVYNDPLTQSLSTLGDWRFTAVTPTFLAAGSYTIGAYYPPSPVLIPSGNDLFIGSSNATEVSLATAGWLTFGQAMYDHSGLEVLARPDLAALDVYNPGLFGPNFLSVAVQPATAGVPEPATWAVMLLGFGAAAGALRAHRRRRTFPVVCA